MARVNSSISSINRKSQKKMRISRSNLGSKVVTSQLGDLASAINNFYNRLENNSDFFNSWRRACLNCHRNTMREMFGESTFNRYHGFIRCTNHRFRHPDHGQRRYHCCILYFWVNDYIVSIDFCYERRSNSSRNTARKTKSRSKA
ncbi:MAG: hypothetical protein K0S39_1096 [Paenibacillus sp.]|jgi:hypothetical protein|nr:hypothetical protein [Paenibacillus sp.]